VTNTKASANILKMKNSNESSDLPDEKEEDLFDCRSELLEPFLSSDFDLSIFPCEEQFNEMLNNQTKRPI
jgi:hypothetical protein